MKTPLTTTEFREKIGKLPKRNPRNLETYLLALYPLLEAQQHKTPDAALVLRLLRKAFTAEPMPLKRTWLSCHQAPNHLDVQSDLPYLQTFRHYEEERPLTLSPIEFTLSVLRFQIAEYHQMVKRNQIGEYSFLGVRTKAGNSWYNFSPRGVLTSGARGLSNWNTDISQLDWAFPGLLLEMGRKYE